MVDRDWLKDTFFLLLSPLFTVHCSHCSHCSLFALFTVRTVHCSHCSLFFLGTVGQPRHWFFTQFFHVHDHSWSIVSIHPGHLQPCDLCEFYRHPGFFDESMFVESVEKWTSRHRPQTRWIVEIARGIPSPVARIGRSIVRVLVDTCRYF